jgi:hypothetical protein
MWPQALLLLTAGAIGAAFAITVIAALRKWYRR